MGDGHCCLNRLQQICDDRLCYGSATCDYVYLVR